MSKTIRRKTHKSGLYEFEDYAGEIRVEFSWAGKTHFISPGFGTYRQGEYVILTKKQEIELKARFHSDSFETMRNAPKWYRQMLNRTLRSKQKQYLREAIKNETLDDYAEPKFIKDAAWYW